MDRHLNASIPGRMAVIAAGPSLTSILLPFPGTIYSGGMGDTISLGSKPVTGTSWTWNL